jgi:ACDE family multidrug resistance protein
MAMNIPECSYSLSAVVKSGAIAMMAMNDRSASVSMISPAAKTQSPAARLYFLLTTPGPILFAFLFLLDSFARSLLAAVMSLEAFRYFGSSSDVSLMAAVAGCSGVLANFALPAIIDLLRPRRTYLLAIALLTIASLLMLFGTVYSFALGWFLRQAAAAGLLTSLNIYIATYIKKRDLAVSEPIRTFMSASAWVMGPTVGVTLYADWPDAVFMSSAIFGAVLLVYFCWLKLEAPTGLVHLHPLTNIKRYFVQPRLRLAWILNFGRETWWVTLFTYAPIYIVTSGLPKERAGYLLSTCTGLLFLTLGLGWIGRKLGLRHFVCGGFLVTAAGTMLAAWFSDRPILACAALIGSALGAVSLDSVVVVTFLRAVRSWERPQMTMVFCIYRDAAGLLPPAFFALLLLYFPLPSVFVAASLFCLLCAGLSLFLPKGM